MHLHILTYFRVVFVFRDRSKSWAKGLQENLKIIKSCLKSDYKLHVADERRCADHCRARALSDVTPEFQEKCRHQHVICDSL